MPHLQGFVALLPFGLKLLKSLRPVPYERVPQTLGQHLRKRRLEMGLFQRDLRERFKLEKETYANWEKDRCYPAMNHWPGIIAVLGVDPSPMPVTTGDRLKAYRRQHGISRNALAAALGADERTVWRWESGCRAPINDLRLSSIERLLAASIKCRTPEK